MLGLDPYTGVDKVFEKPVPKTTTTPTAPTTQAPTGTNCANDAGTDRGTDRAPTGAPTAPAPVPLNKRPRGTSSGDEEMDDYLKKKGLY